MSEVRYFPLAPRHFWAGVVLLLVFGIGGLLAGRGCVPRKDVWVNSRTGVYHCANDQWAGRTLEGKWLSEPEARRAGYRPANGKECN